MDICVRRTAVENTVWITIGALLFLANMLGILVGIIATLNQVRKKIINFVDSSKFVKHFSTGNNQLLQINWGLLTDIACTGALKKSQK